MSIEDLQQRAESAAVRFRQNARRPIVIEFAGVPKAGKSSTIAQVCAFLKRCGFNVKVVVERASVCPIRDKKHATFNVWTACTTLAQILENTQDPPRPDDPDVLVLDRGIFDAVCWLTMMDRLKRLSGADREAMEGFLLLRDWQRRITGVVVMFVSPRDALGREQGFLPVTRHGSIMNEQVLQSILDTTKDCVKRLKTRFRILEVDTSKGKTRKQEQVCKVIAGAVLDWVEELLAEDVLCVPRQALAALFERKAMLVGSEAEGVVDFSRRSGQFRPRASVEGDKSVIQPLPVVVVRNRSGDILQMKRREKDESNPLHQKVVIWAGGHVRKEDSSNGDAILSCVRRELNEELRLSVEDRELRLLGAVYVPTGERTSKHLALVYEWRAPTDEVAVTLSSSEFFERRGTSLSGRFISLAQLVKHVSAQTEMEPWSHEILKHLCSQHEDKLGQTLFE